MTYIMSSVCLQFSSCIQFIHSFSVFRDVIRHVLFIEECFQASLACNATPQTARFGSLSNSILYFKTFMFLDICWYITNINPKIWPHDNSSLLFLSKWKCQNFYSEVVRDIPNYVLHIHKYLADLMCTDDSMNIILCVKILFFLLLYIYIVFLSFNCFWQSYDVPILRKIILCLDCLLFKKLVWNFDRILPIVFISYTPWNHQKTKRFLMNSRGIILEHWQGIN